MVYRDIDGNLFKGSTAARVVVQMRKQAWCAAGKLDYMHEVAKRVSALGDGLNVIDVRSPEYFLASLENAKLLQLVSN